MASCMKQIIHNMLNNGGRDYFILHARLFVNCFINSKQHAEVGKAVQCIYMKWDRPQRPLAVLMLSRVKPIGNLDGTRFRTVACGRDTEAPCSDNYKFYHAPKEFRIGGENRDWYGEWKG